MAPGRPETSRRSILLGGITVTSGGKKCSLALFFHNFMKVRADENKSKNKNPEATSAPLKLDHFECEGSGLTGKELINTVSGFHLGSPLCTVN